jgi:hypothetical protein
VSSGIVRDKPQLGHDLPDRLILDPICSLGHAYKLAARHRSSLITRLRKGTRCNRQRRRNFCRQWRFGLIHKPRERPMHGLIYLVGLVVVILAILSLFGLR